MTGLTGAPPAEVVVTLGAGLTRLGRPWGVHAAPVPSDAEAQAFLQLAVRLGVRLFDTAPSYGASEARLGRFLLTLPSSVRATLLVATKGGEQWDPASGVITVDHTHDALLRSLDTSMERLGSIDLYQLHRPAPGTIRTRAVARAMARARARGVAAIGASVTSVDDGRAALDALGVEWLQFPWHVGNEALTPLFALAWDAGCHVLVNRPFGMGALVSGPNAEAAGVRAFRAILRHRFRGAVLTGTASPRHLRANLAAFAEAARPVHA